MSVSALAVLVMGFFMIVAYLDKRGTDVGGIDVAGEVGLGWVSVAVYGLMPALAVIWGPERASTRDTSARASRHAGRDPSSFEAMESEQLRCAECGREPSDDEIPEPALPATPSTG